MAQHSNIALTLCALATCCLLALAAPPKLNAVDNEEKVGMRYFPGTGYSGLYPGSYPGSLYPGMYPGVYPGVYPGPYANVYGRPFRPGYSPFGYPLEGYPGGPIMFYNNKNGNAAAGNPAASRAGH